MQAERNALLADDYVLKLFFLKSSLFFDFII